MLPEALLCLLNAAIIYAQARQQIALNNVANFTAPNPPFFTIPSADQLTVSIALCASGSSPRFFISNSSVVDDPGSGGGTDVFEIVLNDGQGSWTGGFRNGGVLGVENAGQATFEVSVSESGAIHERLSSPPLLGDTTSNQAIIFSHPFSNITLDQPSYPNYTLPAANISSPTPPNTNTNFTLFVAPTSSSALTSLPKTGCALRAQTSEGKVESQSPWLRDEKGWRQQWLMGTLSPATNYTAYIVQDNTRVSGPIMFSTKSASFSCPLVASLPYCPNIAYSVPLPPPPTPAGVYDASTVPDSISTPLLSGLSNFTTSLLTFACGADFYSPLVSCADCQREYRRWLCTISFPRCGEASPKDPTAFTRVPAAPSATGLGALPTEGGPQQVLSALVPQATSAPPRNPNFPQFNREWTMLLPCLETCNAVDRACPHFMGFRCPVRRFNAAATYGVGYIDTGDDDGKQGAGVIGSAQDQWGNIWCNSG